MTEPSEPLNTPTVARPDRLAIRQSIGYFAIFIGLGMTAASLGPTLQGLADHTHSTISQVSILFTSRSFGYLLGSLRGGRAYDRLPGHRLLVGVLLVMAVMNAIVPIVNLLWLLAATLFILGLAEGAADVGGNTLLVWTHHERVGPYMNTLHFFFGLGAFIVPILIAQTVLATHDIKMAYWLLALYMLPVAIYFIRLPSPRPITAAQSLQVGPINLKLVALIVAFYFLYVGAEASYGGWIYTYATSLDLADAETAAYLTSILWGTFTVGRLVAIPLATRYKPQTLLTWDLIGCVASLILILAYPDSLLILGLGTAGLGFSMASIFPGMMVYAQRRLTLTGRVTSWFFVGVGAGAMVVPWLIGQWFETFGPRVTMWVIFVDVVLVVTTFIAIRWVKNGSSANPVQKIAV